MPEHPLVVQARAMVADPVEQARVASVAARVQALLDDALQVEDMARARAVLPLAVLELYRAVMPLFSAGLLPGVTWIYQEHHALHQRAVALFGPTQAVVEACPVAPLDPVRRPLGSFLPRP